MAILDLGSHGFESRWRMLLLRAFGPNTDTSNYAGHWWDLNGVITSPPGDLGGLPGLAPVDSLWLIVGALRGLRIPRLSKKKYILLYIKSDSKSGQCKHEKWYYECGILAISLQFVYRIKLWRIFLSFP